MTDVWTSAGLITALLVMLLAPPSWQVLDPILGFIMAVHIVWTGITLIRRSVAGLMDEGLPDDEVGVITGAIVETGGPDTGFHALRTRRAGNRRFIDFHLLVPGAMTVQQSHDLCCAIEEKIRQVPAGGSDYHPRGTERGSRLLRRVEGGRPLRQTGDGGRAGIMITGAGGAPEGGFSC